MYFMQTDTADSVDSSTDQGVDKFVFDTVDNLQSNLFAVSDYYEAGADIHLTHTGFSGVTGINPETKQRFNIPAVYSPEHRGWLVHFVIAKTPSEAREYGKRLEKSLRSKSLVDTSIRNHYLDDSQLLAALAVTRGDITIRDDDEYVDLQLGDWNDDDDNTIRASFAEAFELSDETTSNVTWAYPARSNRKSEFRG